MAVGLGEFVSLGVADGLVVEVADGDLDGVGVVPPVALGLDVASVVGLGLGPALELLLGLGLALGLDDGAGLGLAEGAGTLGLTVGAATDGDGSAWDERTPPTPTAATPVSVPATVATTSTRPSA